LGGGYEFVVDSARAIQLMKGPIRVLVVGPGRCVHGGITSVIESHSSRKIWNKYSCVWLETYDEGRGLAKIVAAIKAYARAPLLAARSEIVHIHVAQNVSFFRKTPLFALAKLLGKKTMIHLHAPYPEDFERQPLRAVSKRVFADADVVVALSDIWARQIRQISPNANIRVLRNPCKVPVTVANPCDRKEPIILYTGTLEKRKGYDDLIRAMVSVVNIVPNARLILAGNGDVEQATMLATGLGIRKSVLCPGWVSGEEKQKLLSKARVFCLPSYGEGVPMSMLEAMAHKIPVVVTPVGGIPDVISNRRNGLVVRQGDIPSIAEAIVEFLTDGKLSADVTQAAYKTIVDHFSLDQVCEQLSQIYEGLAGNSISERGS